MSEQPGSGSTIWPHIEPDDAQRAHFDRIRQDRGWSWATLADYLDQQQTDPASPGLAAWARAQADVTPAKAAAKRTARKATEKR